MSYINRDELYVKIHKAYSPSDNDDIHRGIGIVHNLLNEMPFADVRENNHGEWIEGEEFLFCGETYKEYDKCSVCGRTALGEPWYFCPNCGADMREREESK